MPVALIIGAGSNIGRATAETFAAAGYTVAVASRSPKLGDHFKHFSFGASKPETVSGLFTYSAHLTSPDNQFESSIDDFHHDMNVNATSVWVAAGEAVKCFKDLGVNGLGKDGGTFVFTGNLFNVTVAPGWLTFGMGKSAAAHLIQNLALVAYPGKPYKFYYGDERHADGFPMTTGLSGSAHAQLYLELAKDPEQRQWQQTFVNGTGYVEFPRQEVWAI